MDRLWITKHWGAGFTFVPIKLRLKDQDTRRGKFEAFRKEIITALHLS